jgi:hypothetical protein
MVIRPLKWTFQELILKSSVQQESVNQEQIIKYQNIPVDPLIIHKRHSKLHNTSAILKAYTKLCSTYCH